MKDVLISIRPQWVEKIANGEKTIEIRKTKPKLETPFKCYIYCTIARKNGQPLLVYKDGTVCFGDYRNACNCNANGEVDCYIGEGKVIGEFVCDKIDDIKPAYDFYSEIGYDLDDYQQKETCLTREELKNYGKGKPLFGWHISNLKIYDKPKELSNFSQKCKYAKYQDDDWYDSWFCGNEYVECDWQDCPSCGGESCGYEDYAYCICNGLKPLTRPPQSWCYVEGE